MKHRAADITGKALLTLAVLALASLVLWFISLPEKDYEPVPNQTEKVTASEIISSAGISQTLMSKGPMKGIRVRWVTFRTEPEDDVVADLLDPVNQQFLERVIIPAWEVADNTETDIVFTGNYGPGEYMVMLSGAEGSEDTVAVWECVNDSYPEGEAYDSYGQEEGRDWYFNVLSGFPASLLIRHRVERAVYSALTALAAAAALCWIYGEDRLRKRKRIAQAIGFARKNADRILILLLVLIPTLVYLDFLTGERLYVFSMLDRGADSVGQTVPRLINLASRIQKGQWGELFNFRQGLGDAEAAYFPTLTNWVSLFGEAAVQRLLGVSQWAKVVLSGIFAYLFVKEYGAGTAGRFLIALGYAFNSMLIARGAWESYPNIALLVMLWLYTYERKLNGKGVLPFCFSALFMFINLGLYDCVFYAVLLSGYMLVRRAIREENGRAAVRSFMKDLGLFALFALPGMMDTVRYMLAKTLSSTRLQEGVSEYGETIGEGIFTSGEIWMAAFLRTAGHSISGITWQTSSLNLLEGPAFYTGIAVLLVIPAALFCMKGKQKVLYLLLVLAAFLYIAIIPLRLVMSGFAKETFKLSSFWITLLLLLCAADFFRRAERKELRKGTGAVLALSALAILGLLIAGKAGGYVSGENEWWASMAFLALYLLLTLLFLAGRRASTVRAIACLCAIAEAALVPYAMVHDRNMESASENSWKEYAATREVVASLPQDEWYRIEKEYATVFQSDSLAEGFRGSASYIGGVEIGHSVLDIYDTYSLPRRGNHYLFGSGGNVYFESAASTKYVLGKNDLEIRYGYDLVEEKDGIRVYENRYCHPFVHVAGSLVPPDDLRGKVNPEGRVPYLAEKNSYVFGVLPEDSVLTVKAEFEPGGRNRVYMVDRNGKFSSMFIMGGGNVELEIANPDIYSIWFEDSTQNHLKDISFYLTDKETYYRAYRDYSLLAQQNGVHMTATDENHFTGMVTSEENGYIITAIPYNPKWTICLNGKIQDTIAVNGGFLGAPIPKGRYSLEIRYNGDSWIVGNLFKIIGFGGFLLAAYMIVLYRRHHKKGDCDEKHQD